MDSTTDSVDVKRSKRILWADFLRIFAIFGVVVIHSAAPVMYSLGKVSTGSWLAANFYDTIARAGVPLFVMLSGMMLLDTSKEESLKLFFAKRLKRVLLPFVFWGLIYFFWKSNVYQTPISIKPILKEFITGPIYYHFWFIYMIIGLYLVTPILRQYVKNTDTKNLKYFIILWFIYTSILPFAKKYFNLNIGIQLQMVSGYIGYFVLGYLLKKLQISRKYVIFACIALAAGLSVTFLGTSYFSSKNGNVFEEYFYDYMSPNTVLMSIGIFIIFMAVNFGIFTGKLSNFNKAVIYLSEASFGVYLVHVLVLELLDRGILGIKISGLAFNPLISIPVTSTFTILISYIIVILIKKIPVVRYFV